MTNVASPHARLPADRPAVRRSGRASATLWLGLLAFFVYTQWPMLKGWVYRASDRPIPPPAFTWYTSFAAAQTEAQRTGRLIFVDFQASWCPPCIVMSHDVWPDPAVGRLLTTEFVPVSIDVDTDPEGAAARYGVTGIPTMLVLDSGGRTVRRATYMSRNQTLRFLAGDAGRVPADK
jgi:thiol:disulfide interchange protein